MIGFREALGNAKRLKHIPFINYRLPEEFSAKAQMIKLC
jgi:hypothetical protein